ncbi:hypothetical protein SAMN06264849_102382 [Melghirimyces algeriensis]|uniref:Uncharacterized protein n=1 Tax=Melghirimyces algeriensis TaxID=910412 RepID=A0A521BSZ1_9BACL|nr:hypothetical protein SAMN06264849_102382 [Melghirimyces algeriensis]
MVCDQRVGGGGSPTTNPVNGTLERLCYNKGGSTAWSCRSNRVEPRETSRPYEAVASCGVEGFYMFRYGGGKYVYPRHHLEFAIVLE